MSDDIVRFFQALGSTILWSVVAIVIVAVVFEVLDRRYRLMKEIFDENSTAAAEKWAAEIGVPAYATDDQTAIKVVNGVVEVISEGHWLRFNGAA